MKALDATQQNGVVFASVCHPSQRLPHSSILIKPLDGELDAIYDGHSVASINIVGH